MKENNIEHQYLKLLKDILKNGVEKADRTGTGTISVFGRQIRHDMKLGFPLLTTKKMYTKGIISELLWFLQGRTDLRWLLEHDNTIWVGDAYRNYLNNYSKDLGNGKHESLGSDIKWVSDDEWPNGKALPFTKEEFIDKIKTDDEFAKKWGSLGKIYGYQWRNWGSKTMYDDGNPNPKRTPGMDQITNLINDLKTNPDSRRLLLSAWNASDLPHQVLPPCHYGFQFYTRKLNHTEKMHLLIKAFPETINSSENVFELFEKNNVPKRAISLMWNQRSVDTPLGLPFNIASYALLLEIIGKIVNMVPDELIGNLGDTHIYKNQIDGVREQLNREPYNLPSLKISDNVNFDGSIDDFLNSCSISDFKIENYESHPTIKFPLSN
jgi:thymidylate synthase